MYLTDEQGNKTHISAAEGTEGIFETGNGHFEVKYLFIGSIYRFCFVFLFYLKIIDMKELILDFAIEFSEMTGQNLLSIAGEHAFKLMPLLQVKILTFGGMDKFIFPQYF